MCYQNVQNQQNPVFTKTIKICLFWNTIKNILDSFMTDTESVKYTLDPNKYIGITGIWSIRWNVKN